MEGAISKDILELRVDNKIKNLTIKESLLASQNHQSPNLFLRNKNRNT